MRKKALKFMKFAVVVGVTGALFVPNAVRQIPASATSIKEVQQKINETENQIKDINNRIDTLSDEQDLIQEKIDDITAEIVNTMTSIGMKEDEIEKCRAMAQDRGIKAVLMFPHLYSLEEGTQYRKVIGTFDEVYIRNVDDLAAVIHMCEGAVHFTRIYLGASLYAYNDEAIRFLYELTEKCADEVIFEAPLELNKKEAAGLRYPAGTGVMRLCYGKTALMITAAYAMRRGEIEVTDDKINSFFIIPNAILDYNTVLNGIPECLFAEKAEIGNSLLCFTDEKPEEIKRVIAEYKKGSERPDFKFTRGHYYRGIE